MKNRFLTVLFTSGSLFALLCLAAPQTFAIGIRPVREEVSLPPGQSSTGEITIINESDKDFMAEPVIDVFYKTDESGIPVYANEKTKEIEDVRTWLDIPTEPVNVPANGSTIVKYTIKVPDAAEAGGKYMSIAYQPVKTITEGVAINVRAASLLLINVEGDTTKKGELTAFTEPKEMLGDQPFNFSVVFKTTGNTHVKPIGWIEVVDTKTNEKLKEIARYVDPVSGQAVVSDKIPVNLNEGNVLPGNERTFEGEWTQNIKPGDYKATLSLTYDKEMDPITKEISFKIDENLTAGNFVMNTEGATPHFDFVVKNQGNVSEKLSGGISIENMFGYKVAEIPLPEEKEYLATGQEKSYKLNWGTQNSIPEGRYTAKLQLNYGYDKQTIVKELSFGEIDRTKTYLIGALVVVVLIALFAIFKKRKQA